MKENKKVEIYESNLNAAYQVASENGGDERMIRLLDALTGKKTAKGNQPSLDDYTRVGTIDQLKANIQVNREKKMITLTVEERDAYNKSKIVGTVAFTETYDRFGINDPQAGWTPAKLGQFIRLNRGVFEERQECMKLVSQLKNFTAKAKAEIQKQRDPSGSTADVYRQEVESNLPKSFTVNLAIFKGTAKQSIEVEFDHYLKDGEVFLQLVSPGANELTETYRDQCIDDVLDKIREVAPDIAILEV